MLNLRGIHMSLAYTCIQKTSMIYYQINFDENFREVAQLASVRALGAWGRGFESHLPDHL